MSGDPQVLRDELAAIVNDAFSEVPPAIDAASAAAHDAVLNALAASTAAAILAHPRVRRALTVLAAAEAWVATVVLADESKDPRHRTPVTASRRLKNAVLGVDQ